MTGRALFLTGFLAFLTFAIIRLPASIVVPRMLPAPVGYSVVDGTLWHGTLQPASLKGRRLGDASFTLDFQSLLTGTPAANISLSGGEAQGSFYWRHENGDRISNLEIILDIKAHLGSQRFAGALRLIGGDFRFAPDGRCSQGTAEVRTNVVELALGQKGPLLAGDMTCQQGAMKIALAGKLKDLTVTIDGQIGPKAGEGLRLSLTPAPGADIPEDIVMALAHSGFSREANGSMTAQLELEVFL